MRATIHFMPVEMRRNFIFVEESKIEQITECFKSAQYRDKVDVAIHSFKGDSEAFAEEMFDLTNNPSRQDERELLYGTGRSVSTGDIIAVEDKATGEFADHWLCMSFGWKKI